MTRWLAAARRGAAPASRRGATGPCWSAAPACTSRPWSTASRPPGRYPEVRGRAGGRARHRGAAPAAWRPRPGGGRPDGARQPAPGRAGPRGDHRQRPPFLRLRARAWRAYPPTAVAPGRAVAAPAEVVAARIAAALRRHGRRPGWSTRCAGLAAGRRACPGPPARPSATGRCSRHLEGGVPLDEALAEAEPPDPGLRPPPADVVAARPPDRLVRGRRQSARRHRPAAGRLEADHEPRTLTLHKLPRARQRLPGAARPGGRTGARRRAGPARSATATAASAPTA